MDDLLLELEEGQRIAQRTAQTNTNMQLGHMGHHLIHNPAYSRMLP
jgi:hypothetical protein